MQTRILKKSAKRNSSVDFFLRKNSTRTVRRVRYPDGYQVFSKMFYKALTLRRWLFSGGLFLAPAVTPVHNPIWKLLSAAVRPRPQRPGTGLVVMCFCAFTCISQMNAANTRKLLSLIVHSTVSNDLLPVPYEWKLYIIGDSFPTIEKI